MARTEPKQPKAEATANETESERTTNAELRPTPMNVLPRRPTLPNGKHIQVPDDVLNYLFTKPRSWDTFANPPQFEEDQTKLRDELILKVWGPSTSEAWKRSIEPDQIESSILNELWRQHQNGKPACSFQELVQTVCGRWIEQGYRGECRQLLQRGINSLSSTRPARIEMSNHGGYALFAITQAGISYMSAYTVSSTRCPTGIGIITHENCLLALGKIDGTKWFKAGQLKTGYERSVVTRWLAGMDAQGDLESNKKNGKARAYRMPSTKQQ